ncbi:MAG: DUF5788 family protein [Halobacteria archaeon]|nr:DUF5788 family protein [Halobacteria archaeon]
MKEYEREALLERVDREGSFVGVEVPETVELPSEFRGEGGSDRRHGYGDDEVTEFGLRDYVFDVRSSGPEGTEPRVGKVKKYLRRRRKELRRKLEDDDIDYDEGVETAELIAGIDRGLTYLENAGGRGDLNEEARRKETADRKRWFSFVRQVTGSDDGRSSGGSSRFREE